MAASATRDFSGLRVLVVHEWLINWAGAERALADIMSVVPHADLVVGAVSPARRDFNALTRKARETWLGRIPGGHTRHRWLTPLQYPAFAGIDTRGYDLVISSSSGFGKAVRSSDGRPHVCYCYSPPRYLWDMEGVYRQHEGGIMSAALRLGAPLLRRLDRRSAAGVTQFVGISRFVAGRIARAYGRDALVVYPAVAVKPAARIHGQREDFLLSLGRLVSYKRADLAIAAAERLGVRLVIAGDGPERPRLERMAGQWTTFLGEVDESTAGDLMERCRAFVFCAEEDFGMAPIEANGHGAPVVGLARGALIETMTAQTAELFDSPTVDSLADAIQRCASRSWPDSELRENAQRFTPGRFRAEFAAVISAAVAGA